MSPIKARYHRFLKGWNRKHGHDDDDEDYVDDDEDDNDGEIAM